MKKRALYLLFASSVLCLILSAGKELEHRMSLIIKSDTRWGGNEYFQGMPVNVSIFLVHGSILHGNKRSSDSMPVKATDRGDDLFSKLAFEICTSGPQHIRVLAGLKLEDLLIVKSFNPVAPIILERRSPAWVTFEIPPDISSDLMPGSYRLTAAFPGADPDTTWIIIRPAITESDKASVNYEKAEYYLRIKKDYKRANELALLSIGKLEPEHDMVYLTLGDANLGLGELEKAVEYYELFLRSYENDPGWNYPSLVRNTVLDLKGKIAARAEEKK